MKTIEERAESEIWRDVFGYEGIYQASSMGRVKALQRLQKTGLVNNPTIKRKERLLKQTLIKNGYYSVGITKNGVTRTKSVHSIIFEAFNHVVSDRDTQIDHIDNNKLNNRISNLQLLTRRDNTSKSVKKDKPTGVFKNNNNWIARISVKNKLINLGTYPSIEEAEKVYLEYKSKL
ncbi:MAG: hypothetical protein EOM59_21705 [Clostridia bacterium]|nr:hypothetical protein [Clostridia bacterium]